MRMKDSKIIVVLPAYNAAKTLKQTIDDLPALVNEIILVDDNSVDQTVRLAQELSEDANKLKIFKHEKNLGYGGNQKTCYRLALESGGDIIVMVHPDYQYDPRMVQDFVEAMDRHGYDVMLGSRIRSRQEALAGGMPLYKYLSNRMLTIFENLVSGQNLSEWHTGMRAYRRTVLEDIEWQNNSNDFVFDTQMLFQIISKQYSIGEIAVPVRYFKEASSINFRRSLKYGLGTVWVGIQYLFRRQKQTR